jgi:Uma2 family endonuclease
VTIQTSGRRSPNSYAPPLVSWEDFHNWVLGIEGRAEWVDGEIIEIVGDSARHYFLVHFLANLLSRHVDLNLLGLVFIETMLMKLSSRPSGRVPDVFFLAEDHRDRLKETCVEGPADLVVEVVSPDSTLRDRHDKHMEYEAAGIPEYWLIDDLRHEAYFYVLGANGKYQVMPLSDDGIYTSTLLPGVRVKVAWLWRDPLPRLEEALAELG